MTESKIDDENAARARMATLRKWYIDSGEAAKDQAWAAKENALLNEASKQKKES